MKFKCGESVTEQTRRLERWHPWFAWHPVRIWYSDTAVWLETVQRKGTRYRGLWMWEYRSK